MPRISVIDRVSYNITKRTYTDEGFLVVPGRVARTGIQQYLASELGLTDRKPNELINVYRPAEEVFHPDSLASYDASDVTIEHPNEMVSADNYNSTSAGVVRGEATQDGDFVLANMIIKSKDAIDAVESGKVQLSAGYTALYDDTPGITPEGEPYDFVQRDIKINHVALVDRARAGAQARLYDNQGERAMKHKIILDSGSAIEIEDSTTATLVNDSIARLKQAVKDMGTKAEKKQAEADMMKEELDMEKEKSSEDSMSKRIELITKAKDAAIKVAGKTFACDSINIPTIQRAALAMVRDSIDWADKSDVYVQAAFDMAEEKKAEDMEEDMEEEKGAHDSLKQLANDAAVTTTTKDAEPVKSAYQKFKDSQANMHKG